MGNFLGTLIPAILLVVWGRVIARSPNSILIDVSFFYFQLIKTKRNKRQNPSAWKQNVSKQKRLKGEPYNCRSGKDIGAAQMGPPCQSQFCQKAKNRNCPSVTEEERSSVFQQFWQMKTWDERRLYVRTLITKVRIADFPSSKSWTSLLWFNLLFSMAVIETHAYEMGAWQDKHFHWILLPEYRASCIWLPVCPFHSLSLPSMSLNWK